MLKYPKPKKKLSYRALIKKLDRIFSLYIRKRDSDSNGYGFCISCGKSILAKEAHAGHFCNRSELSLRYDEKNVNLQCVHCNTFREGNPPGYVAGLQKKYGDDILKYIAASRRCKVKFTCEELEILIKLYKDKLK